MVQIYFQSDRLLPKIIHQTKKNLPYIKYKDSKQYIITSSTWDQCKQWTSVVIKSGMHPCLLEADLLMRIAVCYATEVPNRYVFLWTILGGGRRATCQWAAYQSLTYSVVRVRGCFFAQTQTSGRGRSEARAAVRHTFDVLHYPTLYKHVNGGGNY